MGADYHGFGGIGIKVTDEIINKAIENNLFTKEDWENDEIECLELFDLAYDSGGNAFTGNTRRYLFVDGNTLGEINKNTNRFVKRLSEIGIEIEIDDLEVISDYFIYC